MKLLASFLCTFLLLMFLGTLSYVYILWHHYWLRVEKLAKEQRLLQNQQQHSYLRQRQRHAHGHQVNFSFTKPFTQSIWYILTRLFFCFANTRPFEIYSRNL